MRDTSAASALRCVPVSLLLFATCLASEPLNGAAVRPTFASIAEDGSSGPAPPPLPPDDTEKEEIAVGIKLPSFADVAVSRTMATVTEAARGQIISKGKVKSQVDVSETNVVSTEIFPNTRNLGRPRNSLRSSLKTSVSVSVSKDPGMQTNKEPLLVKKKPVEEESHSHQTAKDKSTAVPTFPLNKGSTILLRSGSRGVCATPYGKMTVGQSIHWIGCRKIVCRSERGFAYLLEQTCSPLPGNLPPGCTIIQPSQTLPYPYCCPVPNCPPLQPRLPQSLLPLIAINRTRNLLNEKNTATEENEEMSPTVKIEESRGKAEMYTGNSQSTTDNATAVGDSYRRWSASSGEKEKQKSDETKISEKLFTNTILDKDPLKSKLNTKKKLNDPLKNLKSESKDINNIQKFSEQAQGYDKLIKGLSKNKGDFKANSSDKLNPILATKQSTIHVTDSVNYGEHPDFYFDKEERLEFNSNDLFNTTLNEELDTSLDAPKSIHENSTKNIICSNSGSSSECKQKMTRISFSSDYPNNKQLECFDSVKSSKCDNPINATQNNTKYLKDSVPKRSDTLTRPVDQFTNDSAIHFVKIAASPAAANVEERSKILLNPYKINSKDIFTSNLNIIEAKPNYIRLLSLLKNSVNQQNNRSKAYSLLYKPKISNNLNKDERITLSIISEAIGKGLDILLKKPLENAIKKPSKNITNLADNDFIEFIYLGVNQTPQSNNTDVHFLNANNTLLYSTKQGERLRRNTKLDRININSIKKYREQKTKPTFYIPWRQRMKKFTKSDTATVKASAITDSIISGDSSTIVEITTLPSTEETPEIFLKEQETTPKTDATVDVETSTATQQIAVNTTMAKASVSAFMKRQQIGNRRSRTRMTIPEIRPNRIRYNTTRVRLNERLSSLSKTPTTKHLAETKEPDDKKKYVKSKASTSRESASTDSDKNSFSAGRLNVRTQDTPKHATQDAPTVDKKITIYSGSPSNKTQTANKDRLQRMRDRLLRRKTPLIINKKDQIAESQATAAEITTDHPEALTNNIIATDAKATTLVPTTEKQTATLTRLSVENNDSDNEIKPTSKPTAAKRKISSQLRFQNLVNPRKRSRIPIPNYANSSSVLSALSHEPSKDIKVTTQKLDNALSTSESDESLNAIDSNTEKVNISPERTSYQNSTKLSKTDHRTRLLKIIRERAKTRNVHNTKPASETTHTDSETVQSIIPYEDDIKKIPIRVFRTEIPKSVPLQAKREQSLNPKPITRTVKVSSLPSIQSLTPIKITQNQDKFQQTVRPPIIFLATNAPPQASSPQPSVRNDVKQHVLVTRPPPHASRRIVTFKQPSTENPTVNIHYIQPLRPVYIPAQPPIPTTVNPLHSQPSKVYHPINQLFTTPVQTQQHNSQQQVQHPIQPYQTQQLQDRLHPQTNPFQKNPHQRIQSPPVILNHQRPPASPLPQTHAQQSHFTSHKNNKEDGKEDEFESLLPTIEDFPEMRDDYEFPTFDFGNEEYQYKDSQFVMDYHNKKKDAFSLPKESKQKTQKIPDGAKVTEKEYFVEGPSGAPIKITTVTFHTSKSSVRNENIKNRSSHFKKNPFVKN